MEKLKTLKDIERVPVTLIADKKIVFPQELKQEAVKRMKAKNFLMSVADWYDFFNISEEDLKWKYQMS